MIEFKTVYYGNPLLGEFCRSVIDTEPDTSYHHWWTDDRMKRIFYNVELCLVHNNVIGFSGCSVNNGRLRVAQQHYTLLGYRQKYRDLLIRENGFMDRHISTAKDLGLNKILITMHAFNKKTIAVEKIYKNKRQSYRHLKNLQYKGIEKINDVDQHCYEMMI